MILLFIRIRRLPVLDYLGIRAIRFKPLLVSFVLLAVLWFGLGYLYSKAGVDIGGEDLTDIFRACPSKVLLFVTMVICAPAFEELLFRGFLFRGIAAKAGPFAAVLLPSVLFASLHVQYKIWGMLYIFYLGLLLGSVRWFTRSTTNTILMHAAVNFVAFLGILYQWK